MVTAADIEAEHVAALASLTPAQDEAVKRLRLARNQCAFGSASLQERLKALFERDADARNRALAA